jgi:hypothetical protein
MMKETLELRINYDYASLLFKADEGKNLGTSVKVVELSKEDPRYDQIPVIENHVRNKYDRGFFFGWEIKRKYGKKELEAAPLLHMKIKTTFDPAGEESGTVYDETTACEICGANRKQVSPLKLKKGSIPKKDIARTIAGEIVVSEKFADVFKKRGLKGAILEPVLFEKGTSNYYQLVASSEVELSQNTFAGINPFDLSTGSKGEIYKCPKGHTIGLNLLSEAYALNSQSIGKYDFFESKQKIGVKRGLLRPEPLYLCSPAFRKMVEEEKLKGFDFEIAHIE